MYPIQNDFKDRMRRVGMTGHDLSTAISMPPGTVSTKLNGYSPLTQEEHYAIELAIAKAEEAQIRQLNG